MFTGAECPHCDAMRVLCAKLAFDEGIQIDEREVWNHPENAKLLESYKTPDCDGLPFFFHVGTGETLCGEVRYNELRDWAKKSL